MNMLASGHRLDGFIIDACLHSGAMAHIYSVHCEDTAQQPAFPIIAKVPRMAAGDGAENLVGFEIEKQILSALRGPHVPRFVAAGDIARLPYLVMEYVQGKTLQDWLDQTAQRDPIEVARIGALIAGALHALHEQDVCHMDLKPANILLREGDGAVLLDFGLSWHAQHPDLLAEELRTAVGSHVWIAPEQIVGVRGDPRSDIFALGVMLYEMCTRELPFGEPQTRSGLRQRLWMQPRPPRQIDPAVPEWLQEIILTCLQPHAADRYASAGLLAFDLAQPEQVTLTSRGKATQSVSIWRQFGQRFAARNEDYEPSPVPARQTAPPPIVMVAVPHHDVSEATLEALRQAAKRVLGNRPGARLSCVTVVAPASGGSESEVAVHQQMLMYLRQWSQTVDLADHRVTWHVLDSTDRAQAILGFAEANHVNVIILGAATHGLQMQRFVATVPIKVAMHAPCTVMLVKALA